MPANEEEIEECREEGIEIMTLITPTRIIGDNGRVKAIECIKMALGEPDASGRRRPVEVKGSNYTLPCDWVISAIGQEADLGGVQEDTAIKVTKWKTITAKQGTFDTDRPGVFAGGDIATGADTVIKAMGAGKRAAAAIDRYIKLI